MKGSRPGSDLQVLFDGLMWLYGLILRLFIAVGKGMLTLISATYTFIAWTLSPRFREQKRRYWKGKPSLKYQELGWGGLCVAMLLGYAGWKLAKTMAASESGAGP